MEGFESFPFEQGGLSKTVYRIGTGPALILLHELPGMVPDCVELARKLAREGYAVYLPLLFGEPMKNYGAAPLLWPCVWKEFSVLSSRARRPAADWLRALARRAHAERGGRGVGAIGMCFTGSFALAMMLTPEVIAPVLSQPSPPGVPPWRPGDLGLSAQEWDCARSRSEKEGLPVLGFRFTGDPLCRKPRFDALRGAFGPRFRPVEIEGQGHSVLTLHFKRLSGEDRARVWRELTDFLGERLS